MAKGYPAWNKGLTKETDERVKQNTENSSKSLLGRKSWNEGLTAKTDVRLAETGKKIKATRIQNDSYQAWNKGLKKETDERIAKQGKLVSKSRKDKSWEEIYGYEQSLVLKEKARLRLMGNDRLELPYGIEWLSVRKRVLERDNYVCQVCGNEIKECKKVHHIIPYRVIKKHNIKYLASVCKNCHLRVEPKSIPTEEITFDWYINYYISKGGKLPLETIRETSFMEGDIVRTSTINKIEEISGNTISI